MYGYIVTNTPELKIKEYTLYNAYYCGLCHSLKEQYGNIPRFTLSYDLTFLTVLLTSLYEKENRVSTKKCLKKMGQKKLVYQSEITEYVADMSILLAYLKCEDDINDEKKFKAKVLKFLLSKDMKKVREKYPQKVERIIVALKSLTIEEFKDNREIDFMGSFFGTVFGEVFAYKEDIWKDHLYNIGYYLGEFIYILDAYDDLEEDIKNNRYNPFKDTKDLDAHAKKLLEIVICECTNSFEMLPIVENIDLLRNILYSGVWSKYDEKLKAKED